MSQNLNFTEKLRGLWVTTMVNMGVLTIHTCHVLHTSAPGLYSQGNYINVDDIISDYLLFHTTTHFIYIDNVRL